MLSRPLVGREGERHRLAAALNDPAVPLIVVRGPAGVGKTALVLEALDLLRDQGALVGFGKHSEDAGGRTARPLGEALGMLLDQALDQLHDPEAGLASLRQALGGSASILSALAPSLLAEDAAIEATPLTSEAATERMAFAVLRFLQWLEGLGQPIVIALDDWGRAAPPATRLYAQLAAATELRDLTLVATERADMPSTNAGPRIDLGVLERGALHALATDRLDGDAVTAAALVELLGAAATPLRLLQSLTALVDSGALSPQAGRWVLDRPAAVAALGEDVAEILVRQVQRGAVGVRQVLAAAAIYGDVVPRDALEAVAGAARFAEALADLTDEGVLEDRGTTLRFAHDSLRSAALRATPASRRSALAARWSEHLRREDALQGPTLAAALRLRLEAGLDGIDARAWAPLFARGAGEVRGLGESGQASAFAAAALRLEDEASAPTFGAAREAGLAALQDGDLAAGAQLAGLMERRARNDLEFVEAAELAVFAARLSGDQAGALEIGRTAVGRVGLHVPPRGTVPAILAALLRLKLTPDVPAPEARRQGAATYRLLNTVGSIAFERDPTIAVILAARSAAHAPLRGTAFAAALRTVLACLSGDWRAASRWGETAFARLENDEPLRAPAMQLALQFGLGLTVDAARQMAEAERLQALALQEGDLGVAAYANRDRALASMRMPTALARHRAVLAECKAAAGRFQDLATAPLIDALDQMAVNLTDGGDEPWRLRGAVFDSPRFEREAGAELERVAMACMTFETVLANAFRAWGTTLAVSDRMAGRFDGMKHHPVAAIWAFHCGLARARLGQPIRKWERFVVDRCARFNPSYLHRALAFRAEAELRAGRTVQGLASYEAAVVAADASGFQLECGIVAAAAYEAAETAGRSDLAERFAASAQAAWRRMGAWALVTGGAEARALAEVASDRSGLRLEAAAADRASRAKTRLLAGAAHELRTPMQGIQGLLDLAADDPAALDVRGLREAFGSLRAVVDDLTELGAVEAERVAIVEAPYVPRRLADTELAIAASEASRRERPLRLTVTAQADQVVLGDAGRIAQIVRNLLANALRYGEGEVELILAGGDDAVTFEVADRGPGLSEADLTRLFQPFVRGDASARAEGSGLGLALSRRLAQSMGGTLAGENREGGGAVFRLTLPRRLAEEGAAVGPAGPLRILLAEDVALSRDTLARLLERQGHTVTAVSDGAAAVEAARVGGFDLVMLDVRMPRLDGPDALARMRREGLTAPALVLSAAVDEALARRLASLEPVRLVRKPLPADQLAVLLAAVAVAPAAALDAVLGEDAPAIRVQARAALQARLDAIRAGIEAGDLAAIAEHAHAAAGLAGQFGHVEAEAAFAAIEDAARRGDGDATRAAVAAAP